MGDVVADIDLREALDGPPPLDFARPASGQIHDILRDALVQMRLRPGARLSEVETARALAASRTPVREAFIRLAEGGLLEIRPNRGTFVAKLDRERIVEARFLREALEVAIVERLALAAPDERFLAECRALVERQEALAAERRSVAFNEADDAFHQRLVAQTGFSRVGAVIKAEEAHGVRIRVLSLRNGSTYARIVREHRAILDAIAARDPEAAADAVRAHLRNVHAFIAEAYAQHPEYFAGG